MLRWAQMAALMALGCGDGASVPVPSITDPTCGWVEREAITAEKTCVRLVAGEGAETRFVAHSDGSCEGAPCVVLQPGEMAVVIGPLDIAYADYDRAVGDCALLACP